MSTSRIVENAKCTNSNTGTLQNIVPIKGSLYASDGNEYTKLPVGVDDDVLTSDSTQTQGLIWKPYFNPTTPTVTFNLFSCIGWSQGETYYSSWGTNPPAGNHDNPNVISFDFDTYVIALGFKPRASTNSGDWVTSGFPGNLWNGIMYLDIVGWADNVNPTTAPTVMSPAAPHFSILNSIITTNFMPIYFLRSAGTEIFIPARTKFCIRSTYSPGTTFKEPGNDHYGTGNIVLRGVPN